MRHPDRVLRAFSSALVFASLLALGSGAVADSSPGGAGAHPANSITPQPPAGGDAALPLALDANDETATLQAVHIGLTEMPDGANFVWKRAHGRLSGVVKPLFSFKDANGNVCRHVMVTLKSGAFVRTAEGIACREPDGRWALEG